MSTLLIGDIHGCYNELEALLEKSQFDAQKDTLWITGDLVARGPDSLSVLRLIYSLRNSVRLVLGNHDIHLLAIHAGIASIKKRDNLAQLLAAPDCDELLDWLRCQPLLQIDEEKKLVMVHAGISPQWDITTTKRCAKDVEKVLKSDSYSLFLDTMYGDFPNSWSESLSGLARLRFITNVLTRMRYCYPNGSLDFDCKEAPDNAPKPLKPWFNLPNSVAQQYSIVFGHWASLKGKGTPEGFYPLDTGCCWGKKLTMLRWEDKTFFKQKAFNRS